MYMIMEQWGDIDAGEAAAFGVGWLLRTRFCTKEELIKQWSGKANSWDGTMSDRTFCCLRTWAVTRPNEMRNWIQKQSDAEIRNALTWLLDHPLGGHPPLP
jgi:hypothetical protein